MTRTFAIGDRPIDAAAFSALIEFCESTQGDAHGFTLGVGVTGADIVAAARTLLGVKYVHQGRTREGLDCIGLPVLVRAELGLPALDAEPGYARSSTAFEMLDFCRANMIEVAPTDIQPGDILVQINGTTRHMAIVCDYPLSPDALGIIHAWLPNRRVTECRLDEHFMQTVRGCFRFPEVTA